MCLAIFCWRNSSSAGRYTPFTEINQLYYSVDLSAIDRRRKLDPKSLWQQTQNWGFRLILSTRSRMWRFWISNHTALIIRAHKLSKYDPYRSIWCAIFNWSSITKSISASVVNGFANIARKTTVLTRLPNCAFLSTVFDTNERPSMNCRSCSCVLILLM